MYSCEEEAQLNINGKVTEEGYIYPVKVTREKKAKHVDTLLISEDETNHYCLIKIFSRLVGSQYSAHGHELAYGQFCLHGFYGKPGQVNRLDDAKRIRNEHVSFTVDRKLCFPTIPL